MLFTISPQGLSESAVAAKLVVAEQRFKEPSRSDGTCEARHIYHINCVVGFCPPNVWRLSLLHQTTQAARTQALMERLVSSLLDKLECLMSRRLSGCLRMRIMSEDPWHRPDAFRLSCAFIPGIQRQLLCLVFIVYS